MSILYNKICGIEIFCHLRQLKIPDGVCLSRPQPRRCTYLSHSHVPSDAVPRVPVHAPPTLHPLSSDGGVTTTRENDSFMFHASSCSEAELRDRSAARLQGEHSTSQQAEESSTLTTLGQNQRGAQLHRSHDPLPPHSHFERPNTVTQEQYVGCHGATATMCEGYHKEESGTVALTSPSVQTEIVQMRDELKRFHDLKLHHNQLEAQLTARMRQGGNEQVAQVQ